MFENTGHVPVFLSAGFQVALIRIFTWRRHAYTNKAY